MKPILMPCVQGFPMQHSISGWTKVQTSVRYKYFKLFKAVREAEAQCEAEKGYDTTTCY